MTEYELRQQICDTGRKMQRGGMASANDGNLSVRFENGFLCTPTGVPKGDLTPDILCFIDNGGSCHGPLPPSSEIKMHMRVYEKRADVFAVVHAHPPYATTYAIANEPLDRPIMAEAIVALGTVPLAPYGTPSTYEIPDHIEPFLKDHCAVLLANHGALTWGADLRQAYMLMENVEFYARMMYQAEVLGRARELTAEELKKLKK